MRVENVKFGDNRPENRWHGIFIKSSRHIRRSLQRILYANISHASSYGPMVLLGGGAGEWSETCTSTTSTALPGILSCCRKYLNSPTVVDVSRICTEFTRFYDNRIVRSGLKRQTKVFIKLLGTDAVLDRFLVSQCRTCMFQDLDAVQLQEWTRGPARAAALALPCLPVSLHFARVKLRSNLQLSSTLPSRRSPPTEQSKLPTSRDYQTAPSPTLSSRMSPAPTMNKASTAHASDME